MYVHRLATDPHVLIMIPQNGHGYSAHNFRLIYRVSNIAFLENVTEATIDIVGRQEQVLSIGADMAQVYIQIHMHMYVYVHVCKCMNYVHVCKYIRTNMVCNIAQTRI